MISTAHNKWVEHTPPLFIIIPPIFSDMKTPSGMCHTVVKSVSAFLSSRGMGALLMFVVLGGLSQAAAEMLSVGTLVKFDKEQANNPSQAEWVEGEITDYMPGQRSYNIRSSDGTTYTVADDPRWLRASHLADSASSRVQRLNNNSHPAELHQPSAPAHRYAMGAHVQFDRVEASTPERARWDSGVVMERTINNRYKIRGDNGTIYTIQDDPRWILPADAPVPGPRHDYLANSKPAPAVPANSSRNPAFYRAVIANAMPPDGLYNVTNMPALHSVGALEIRGGSYRGLAASGAFKPLRGTGVALEFSGGIAGLEGCRLTEAKYMGLSKIGQPVIKIRYVSPKGFSEELEATKEH